jgi:hypothetical protein
MLGKKLFSVIPLSLVFVLLLSIPAQAKGGAVKVVLSGPGWYGELVVEDPGLLGHLGTASFEDVESSPEIPPDLGAGYLLDRFGDSGEGALPFDRVVYFPDPAGGRGYVYYLETVNGDGPYDGRWFHATPEGEAAIQAVFDAHGVLASAPPVNRESAPEWVRTALSLVPPLAGILVGWLIGRRGRSG